MAKALEVELARDVVTDQYDGNIESMRPVHLHHVTAVRPELAQYLALPTDYRFYFEDDQSNVWFGDDVVNG